MVKLQISLFCLLTFLTGLASGISAPRISTIVGDPVDREFFYTIDQFGGAEKRTKHSSAPAWIAHLSPLTDAEGGFSADVSGKFQLLAYCSRRPLVGMIYLRLLHLQSGVLFKEFLINRNSHAELLASCNHLKFVDEDNALIFNDVATTHKFSLRLGKITHSYKGSERHQAAALSENQKLIIGLSDKVLTWDARTEEQMLRQSIVLPGYSRWGEWDRAAEISPDRKMGFVVASDDKNRSALVWIQIPSGRIKRIFHIAESAKVAALKFINNTTVAAFVNQTSYVWNYESSEPTSTSVSGFFGLEQFWDGHEDVSINQTWDGPDLPDSVPRPPYPPEYTDVMSPDAFPLTISSNGSNLIVYDCCSSPAPKFRTFLLGMR